MATVYLNRISQIMLLNLQKRQVSYTGNGVETTAIYISEDYIKQLLYRWWINEELWSVTGAPAFIEN